MRHLFGCVSVGAVILILTATSVSAQATGELAGRVTDESGGVLPGVTVTATQADTGFMRTVVTDGEGNWVMPNMPTGPYRLEVMLQGFRTYVQTGIVLQVGATPTLNAALAVGSLEETISVEAAAPVVDVRSAGLSEVVQDVHELPLQGRQVTDLIMLVGAAVQTGTADSRSMQGGVNISVAGGLTFGVAYLLDGAMHNNPQNNANLPMPFPDAVQEFSVATSGLTAQNGIHSGASVNVVTRSGTNAFHGNLFEVLRDRRFNATDPFARLGPDGKRVDDGLNRHQYRWHARRTDRSRQAFLFRRIPGHTTAPAAIREHRIRADGGDDCGRLHGVRLASLPGASGYARGSVRRQPYQSINLQSGGNEPGPQASGHDRSVRTDYVHHVRRPR